MTPKGRGSYFMALVLSMVMWQCTATQVGTDTESDMTPAVQTEEDILRLLEEEEMRQQQTLEEFGVPVEEADQALQERESRINELKAELLLKDDRISQLAKQLRERPDMRDGMTGYNEAQFNDRYRQAYLLFNSRALFRDGAENRRGEILSDHVRACNLKPLKVFCPSILKSKKKGNRLKS